jgi:hypothetical protein
MQRLYTAADLPEAHLVAQLLERAGIEACVLNAHAQGGLGNCSLRCSTSAVLGVVGEIPFTHAWPEVWLLDEADVARAQRVLETFTRPLVSPPRRCRDCGEDNPGTFETCWHCGAPLPA